MPTSRNRAQRATWIMPGFALASLMAAAGLLAACNPTVKVEAPDKPIVINLNVKIEQEVRIKVEKDVQDLVANKPGVY